VSSVTHSRSVLRLSLLASAAPLPDYYDLG